MTLTEEQRPTAGFDLEKARDVEKAMSPMPWIVLEEAHGEMIIIRNPNHPMYIDGIVAWGRVAEANTPDAIGIAYMRENFSNLIGEIERLRASLVEHEEHENQTHEVLGNILGTDDTLENVAKRAAARIKELEEAKSRSWQITGDRITAIDQGLRFLEWSNAINGSVETKKHIATLQTMLEETGDKNGFEGRNKMRIETIR
jgi:TolA-binding protein